MMTERIAFLSTLDFLTGVSEPLLHEIAEHMQEMEIPSESILFREGDVGDAVYIVINGTLSIEKNGLQLVTRDPGEIVGEFALIDHNKRSATVIAATDVRVLRWMRDDFQRALSQSRELVLGILRIMTEKLRQGSRPSTEPPQSRSDSRRAVGQAQQTEVLMLPEDDWSPEKILICRSAPMRDILRLINKMANRGSSVLLTGESGSGKEMIARAIHYTSPYRHGPFVVLNCGAVPETLAESELFGHERGAFTGAVTSQKGKIESAQGGTLFLDEVGELPLSMQVKFLRVLDEGRFIRVGGTEPLKMQMRVIAATNRDLTQEVRAGHFRKDLFYRLNVMPIHVPPLRQRREDIPPLAEHFLDEFTGQTRRFAPGVMEYLLLQPWTGNVRELRNVVERVVAISSGDRIELEEILWSVQASADMEEPQPDTKSSVDHLLQRLTPHAGDANLLELVEGILIQAALDQEKGNRTKAAELLGIDRKQIARRLKKSQHPDDTLDEQ